MLGVPVVAVDDGAGDDAGDDCADDDGVDEGEAEDDGADGTDAVMVMCEAGVGDGGTEDTSVEVSEHSGQVYDVLVEVNVEVILPLKDVEHDTVVVEYDPFPCELNPVLPALDDPAIGKPAAGLPTILPPSGTSHPVSDFADAAERPAPYSTESPGLGKTGSTCSVVVQELTLS
jgi:hypothetical protein